MRLIITTLATVAALAVSAVAFAAGTAREEVNASTRGTSNIAPGGKLKLVLTRKSGSQRFHIRINYAVTSRRGTTIGFAVHPCRSTACSGASTSKSRLSRSGNWTVNYKGSVRVVRRAETGPSSRVACVYAQLRDLGADGEGKGRVIRRASGGKGIVTCMNVGRADG